MRAEIIKVVCTEGRVEIIKVVCTEGRVEIIKVEHIGRELNKKRACRDES